MSFESRIYRIAAHPPRTGRTLYFIFKVESVSETTNLRVSLANAARVGFRVRYTASGSAAIKKNVFIEMFS